MSDLTYKLKDKPPLGVTILATVQWFFFTMASTLVVPVVLAQSFQMTGPEAAEFVQRTFIVAGSASLLQILFGHRYPLLEGPAGMWWGIFLVLASMAPTLGKSYEMVGRNLEFGLIVTGVIILLLAVFGVLNRLLRIFTPLVAGTFMMLVAFQMSGSFIKGLLGIGYSAGAGGGGSLTIAAASFVLAVFVFYLSFFGKGFFRSFSVLIGLAAGWGLFLLLGWAEIPRLEGLPAVQFPRLAGFGTPVFDPGITLLSVVAGLILLSNLVASISAMGTVLGEKMEPWRVQKGGIQMGLAHLLSGLWGATGLVSLSVTAGLISMTGIASRLPFFLASLLVLVMGFVPVAGVFFSGLPSPVGYAVLMLAFSQLISIGLQEYGRMEQTRESLVIIGISLFTGVGLISLPLEVLAGMPPLFRTLFGNGLVLGVAVAIFLEQVVFRRKMA